MAKRKLTKELVEELLRLSVDGQISTLKVSKYKSGKNKGNYYIEFTKSEKNIQNIDASLEHGLNLILLAIQRGDELTITLEKKEGTPAFMSLMEVV